MTIQARPFSDTRNSYVVNNDDPGAFDTSFRGRPGTHTEQRCCQDRAPKPLYLTGPGGSRVMGPVNYRALLVHLGANPDELWCEECATALEQLRDELEQGGPLFLHLLAAVAAFIPGIGTAVSAVINSGMALAEGVNVNEAFVAGVKGALPGGAAAEMAFNAGQAALKGEDPAHILIATIPVPDEVKTATSKGLELAQAIASGRPVPAILLDAAYQELPDWGQRAVQIARDVNDGRSAADILASQTLLMLPDDVRIGITAGMAIGHAQALQESATPRGIITSLGKILESPADRAVTEPLAQKGRIIINSGAVWPHSGVQTLLSVVRDGIAWPGQTIPKGSRDWQRGFEIGIGIAEGSAMMGPGQTAVRDILRHVSVAQTLGFDAGTQVQYDRTRFAQQEKGLETMAGVIASLGHGASIADVATLAASAKQGAAMAEGNPMIAAARALNPDGQFRWGFDVGSAICQGSSIGGPGQTRFRTLLMTWNGGPDGGKGSTVAMQGFDVAQALQHGITKANAGSVASPTSGNAAVDAGQLVTQGMAGSPASPDQKAATMALVASNPLARQGAQTAIAEIAAPKSLWVKIKEFFGF